MKGKKGLFLILGLLVLIVVAGLVIKKDFNVTRSVSVDADAATVQTVLGDFNQFAQWNPWGKIDDAMTFEVSGEPGTVGHMYTWSSDNDSVGSGTMTIDDIGDDYISISVDFGEYTISSSHTVSSTDAGTEVTWSASGSSPYLMSFLWDPNESIGGMYESGLSDLQGMIETMEPMASEVEVSVVTLDPMTFVGYKKTVPIDDMDQAYDDAEIGMLYEKVMGVTQEVGPMSTLYYVWDEENNVTELAVAVQVPEGTEVEGYETFTTGSILAARAVHNGSYDNIGQTHEAMMGYISANNYGWDMVNPSMEVYTVGMGDTENAEEYVTEIYHAIAMPEAAEE